MNAPITNRFLRTVISLLFVLHILIVVKLVLLRDISTIKHHFETDYNRANLKNNFQEANFIPFHTLHCYVVGSEPMRYTKENLFGNVLLFIPFGILLPLLFERMNTFRRLASCVFFISSSLEIVQLFTILGNFDTDDIILNMLGASLGFGVFMMTRKSLRSSENYISE